MDPDAKLWNQVYDARSACFESTIGPLSNDILKMMSMIGVWPGGGLFVIPASRLGPDIWAQILVATTITADEMKWSFDHGRPALLERLARAGIGQISMPARASTPL
jgi:hypothetical protein